MLSGWVLIVHWFQGWVGKFLQKTPEREIVQREEGKVGGKAGRGRRRPKKEEWEKEWKGSLTNSTTTAVIPWKSTHLQKIPHFWLTWSTFTLIRWFQAFETKCWLDYCKILVVSPTIDQIVSLRAVQTSTFIIDRRFYGLFATDKYLAECSYCTVTFLTSVSGNHSCWTSASDAQV